MGIKKNIMRKIKSALISLSDKSNLKPLLQELKKNHIKIISSGGTYKAIRKLKIPHYWILLYTKYCLQQQGFFYPRSISP